MGGRVEAALGAPLAQQAGPACRRLAGVQVRAHADGAIDAVEMRQVGVRGSIVIRGQPACMVLRKCDVSTKCPSVTRWSAKLLRSVVDLWKNVDSTIEPPVVMVWNRKSRILLWMFPMLPLGSSRLRIGLDLHVFWLSQSSRMGVMLKGPQYGLAPISLRSRRHSVNHGAASEKSNFQTYGPGKVGSGLDTRMRRSRVG